MKEEDRNTILIVIIILVVCVISLIAIFNLVWQIIGEPVTKVYNSISYTFYIQNLNYNFHVPQIDAIQIEENANNQSTSNTQTDENNTNNSEEKKNTDDINQKELPDYNFNFEVPSSPNVSDDNELQSFPDAILNDAKLADFVGEETTQTNLQIIIPKIEVNSLVLQGKDSTKLLQQGFWIYPSSKALGEGEVLLLCQRRYFGKYDPRSCWFLDKLLRGDEIIVNIENYQLTYRVTGVNTFIENDPLIYAISEADDYIKIITSAPLSGNTHRLVVLAERVN